MALVEIKDFDKLIDNKLFFDKPIKNTGSICIIKYKRIGIDLSRQTNTGTPQQSNFVGRLEEDDGAKMFFIAEKHQKAILLFFFGFINCNRLI